MLSLLEHLKAIGQEHLGIGLEKLSLEEQRAFFSQLQKYPLDLLKRQRKGLIDSPSSLSNVEPWTSYDRVEELKAIRKSKTGCLILAGGQGTRLGNKGPKGTTVIQKKSLFQIFFEKTHAASQQAGHLLPLAVMTSPLNHSETEEFLKKHDLFGLSPEQLFLFEQQLLPFLEDQGNWFLQAPGKLAEGPDGNGGALTAFYEAGIWEKWKALGVECVQVILIDNPLADPFDARLCSYHLNSRAEVTMKCILRDDPEEKVGLVVAEEGRPRVVEYSEISEELREARNPDGSLLFPLANVSLFCFSMEFIQKVAKNNCYPLPWHLQRKKVEDKEIWKYETFIFDLLPVAERIQLLVYPRQETFSPLKNAKGKDSLEAVQAALLNADRRQYANITGVQPPSEKVFELDPAFYYPTSELLRQWKGKPLPPDPYVD